MSDVVQRMKPQTVEITSAEGRVVWGFAEDGVLNDGRVLTGSVDNTANAVDVELTIWSKATYGGVFGPEATKITCTASVVTPFRVDVSGYAARITAEPSVGPNQFDIIIGVEAQT